MTAISAVFHAYKPIPTRKAFQIILEVPEENTAQVFASLGIPNSSTDIWVGVARLEKEPESTATA
jgi:hypothetical protein